MAGNLKIKSFFRPTVTAAGAGGEAGEMAPAPFLTVVVDRFSNGAVIMPVNLAFADYAGLEAEFEDQSDTAVLEAAVVDRLGDADVDYGDYSSAQRSVIDTQIAVP